MWLQDAANRMVPSSGLEDDVINVAVISTPGDYFLCV